MKLPTMISMFTPNMSWATGTNWQNNFYHRSLQYQLHPRVSSDNASVIPNYIGNLPRFATIRAINNTSPNVARSFAIDQGHAQYLVTGRAGGRKQADLPLVNGVQMHLSINPGTPVHGGNSDFHIVAEDGIGNSVAWHYQVNCGPGIDQTCTLSNTRFDARGNGAWWTGLGGVADEVSAAAQDFALAFLESFNDSNDCGENANCP